MFGSDRDVNEPFLVQGDVIALTGINAATLQNWANRGIISLGTQNPGKSGRRYYSEVDAIKLSIIAFLTKFNISPAFSSDLVEKVVSSRVNEWVKHDLEKKEGREFNLDGMRTVRIYQNRNNSKLDIRVYKQEQHKISAYHPNENFDPRGYISFDLDAFIRDVHFDIERLLNSEDGEGG